MRNSSRWLALAGCLLWLAVNAGAQVSRQEPLRQLRPVDEGTTDASFDAFRQTLIAALKRFDRPFIERIVDPDIKVSFGPDSGAAEFHREWKLSDRRDPFWKTMLDTVSLGGQFLSKDLFCAPYVFTAFPEDLDAFTHVAVLTEAEPLRRAPDLKSPVVLTLSHRIVRVADAVPRPGWTRVIAGTQEGFVRSDAVRSPIDYRACFNRTATGWKLTLFVAGD
jgi:hypothetical protein